VAAATGEFGGDAWSSSETFLVGFNRSLASLGGVIDTPGHGEGAVLTVSVQLGVEQIVFGGDTIPGTAGALLHTVKGDGNLPLRGTAAGWCRARLSLHGNEASAQTGVEFVSGWVNRDGSDKQDRAPGGRVYLTRTVAPWA
jgi:hypothetical protein